MEKDKQLKVKLIKMIREINSSDIKNIINSIFVDYNDVYKRYISNVGMIVSDDLKQEELLYNISQYTRKDYEEMISTINTVQTVEEECKKRDLEERIIQLIETMIKDRKQHVGIQENQELSTSDEEDRKIQKRMSDEENIENSILGKIKNIEYINELKNSIIAELKSSENIIINKTKSIKGDKESLEKAKENFEAEMQLIIDKVILKMRDVSDALKVQDKRVCNEIIEIWEQYCRETENENNKFEEQKGQFKSRISDGVHVDEQEAYKKAKEKAEQEEKEIESLPGDFLL